MKYPIIFITIAAILVWTVVIIEDWKRRDKFFAYSIQEFTYKQYQLFKTIKFNRDNVTSDLYWKMDGKAVYHGFFNERQNYITSLKTFRTLPYSPRGAIGKKIISINEYNPFKSYGLIH